MEAVGGAEVRGSGARGRNARLGLAVLAAAAAVCFSGSSARADQQSALGPSADTSISLLLPNHNEGASRTLRVAAIDDSRALVRFDEAQIQSAVGSGTLVSAQLSLQIVLNAADWGRTGRAIDLHRLTSDWTEGTGTLLSAGHGAGATWSCATDANVANFRTDCSGATAWEMGRPTQPRLHPWVEPATASATITNTSSGTVGFDVTPDVAAFLAGSADNDGWLLMRRQELAPGLVAFGSRESSVAPTLVLDVQQSGGAPAASTTQAYANPTLTPDQQAAATAAVQSDPSFTALMGSNPYTIAGVDAWGEDDHAGLVGAIVHVDLDSPAALNGSWPEFVYNGDGSTPATTTSSYDMSLANVTSIDGYVNLSNGSVVGLDPNPDATFSSAPVTTLSRSTGSTALQADAQPPPVDDEADVDAGRATDVLNLVCPDRVNCFYNFDFATQEKDQNRVDWNRVDWPIDTIWAGSSSIDLVKSYMNSEFGWGSHGSAMAASMDGASSPETAPGWAWDTDKGQKENLCTVHYKTPHTRLYAPPDTDQLYSLDYGFYVLGTTHFDWGECVGAPANYLFGVHYGGAGYSETVENLIVQEVEAHPTLQNGEMFASAKPNSVPLGNAEHFTHGDRIAESNGRATMINLFFGG